MDDARQFPPERKGYLDKDALRKLGITKNRMVVKDALFFYQILPPVCDVNKYGIVDDPRQNYFSGVENFSAQFSFNIRLLGFYGHNFKVPTIGELVNFGGVVILDGVRGGINGELYRRWKYNGSGFYEEILNRINIWRWLQIKRVIKLCNNKDALNCGETNYYPA